MCHEEGAFTCVMWKGHSHVSCERGIHMWELLMCGRGIHMWELFTCGRGIHE